MEKKDNNSFKISILIIIITVIAIIIIGYYIYTLKENNQSNIYGNESITSELKVTSPIEQEIIINDEFINKAKETYIKFCNLSAFQNSGVGPIPYILCVLNLDTRENIDKIIADQHSQNEYIKTNTKYDDFKNEMLKCMSSELFENNYSQYKNMNGYVGIKNCAACGEEANIVTFGFVSNTDNKYIFNVVLKDEETYELYPEYNYLNVFHVTFIKENDNFVISEEKSLDK